MDLHVGVGRAPMFFFLGVEIVEDGVAGGPKSRGDAAHKSKELDTRRRFECVAMISGGNLECRKQGCHAMPLVVAAGPGQGAAIGQLQIARAPKPDLSLSVHA